MRAALLPLSLLGGCLAIFHTAKRQSPQEEDTGASATVAQTVDAAEPMLGARWPTALSDGGVRGQDTGSDGDASRDEDIEPVAPEWWLGVRDSTGDERANALPNANLALVVHLDREAPPGTVTVPPSHTLLEFLPRLKTMDVFVYVEEAFFPGVSAPLRATAHRNAQTGAWRAEVAVTTGTKTGPTRVAVAAWTAQETRGGWWQPLDGVDLPLCVGNVEECSEARYRGRARFRLRDRPAPYALQVVRMQNGRVLSAVSGPGREPAAAGGDGEHAYEAYRERVQELDEAAPDEWPLGTLVAELTAAAQRFISFGDAPLSIALAPIGGSLARSPEPRPRLTVSLSGIAPAEFPVELVPLKAIGLDLPGVTGERLGDLFEVEWELPFGSGEIDEARTTVSTWDVYLPSAGHDAGVQGINVDAAFVTAMRDAGFLPGGGNASPYSWWSERRTVTPIAGRLALLSPRLGPLGVYLVGHVGVKDGGAMVALSGPEPVGAYVALPAKDLRKGIWPRPTVLVINGCGSLGLRDEDLVRHLNQAGATTIAGTMFKAPWALVTDFDACFADQLRGLTVAESIGAVFQRTIRCTAARHPGAEPEDDPPALDRPWGEAAHNYRLLGSTDTLIAPLPPRGTD